MNWCIYVAFFWGGGQRANSGQKQCGGGCILWVSGWACDAQLQVLRQAFWLRECVGEAGRRCLPRALRHEVSARFTPPSRPHAPAAQWVGVRDPRYAHVASPLRARQAGLLWACPTAFPSRCPVERAPVPIELNFLRQQRNVSVPY